MTAQELESAAAVLENAAKLGMVLYEGVRALVGQHYGAQSIDQVKAQAVDNLARERKNAGLAP